VYFFQDVSPQAQRQITKTPGVERLSQQVEQWKRSFYSKNGNRAQLLLSKTKNGLCVSDTRPCAVASKFLLTDIESDVYTQCRHPVSRQKLYSFFLTDNRKKINEQAVARTVRKLLEKKLLLQIKDRYLALANFKPRRSVTEMIHTTHNLFRNISQPSDPASLLQKNAVWKWFETLDT
jgi:hypothetical protein